MVWLKKLTNTHCSALVKLIKDEEGRIMDMFVGHSTWDDYTEMVRIFKVYNFEFFNNDEIKATH